VELGIYIRLLGYCTVGKFNLHCMQDGNFPIRGVQVHMKDDHKMLKQKAAC
jgi:hypothetical protein